MIEPEKGKSLVQCKSFRIVSSVISSYLGALNTLNPSNFCDSCWNHCFLCYFISCAQSEPTWFNVTFFSPFQCVILNGLSQTYLTSFPKWFFPFFTRIGVLQVWSKQVNAYWIIYFTKGADLLKWEETKCCIRSHKHPNKLEIIQLDSDKLHLVWHDSHTHTHTWKARESTRG